MRTPVSVVVLALPLLGFLGTVESVVTTATGWPGLLVVFLYSFLVAFVLPLPGELVLLTPLELGLPLAWQFAVLILVASVGKMLGSLVALAIGSRTTRSWFVSHLLRRANVDAIGWVERHTTRLTDRHGYVGLALLLAVPGSPDTITIYAFSVLDRNYPRFAAAAFAGSVARLSLVTAVALGVLAL